MGTRVGRKGFGRPTWSRLLAGLAVVAGGVQLVLQLFVGIPVIWNNAETRRDVHQLYLHAQRARTGEPLYWAWADYGPDIMTRDRPRYVQERMPYPPFLTPALAWLAGEPFVLFQRIWCLFLLGCFWVYAACLARLASRSLSPPWVLGAGAVLASLPGAYGAISVGNVDPLIWALVGLALLSPLLRGAAFASVALIKLYGVWPLAFGLREHWRRVVTGAAAAIALATTVSVVTLGPAGFAAATLGWFRYMLPVVGQGTFSGDNYSLSVAALRLVRDVGWDYAGGPLPGWARAFLLVAGTAAPLAAGVLLKRRSVALQAACVVCAAAAFGPIFWATYTPLLLAPVAVLLGQGRTEPPGAIAVPAQPELSVASG